MASIILFSLKYDTRYCLFLFFLIYNSIILCGTDKSHPYDTCGSKVTCHECIQVPSCGWCSLPLSAFTRNTRCVPSEQIDKNFCPGKYFYSPKNEYNELPAKKLTYGTHKSGDSSSSSPHEPDGKRREVVQLTPQNVHLKLRLNKEQKVKFAYQQAEDYPVDLYYLMDLSSSMYVNKKKLAKLGSLLAKSMREITSDFQLGFGSFVDKSVDPFIDSAPEKINNPCPHLAERGIHCLPTYGFKNVMPLTDDRTDRFTEMVENAELSGNRDNPEGGFDAIMQILACRKEIGWRENARRLLVVSTDARFHMALDGKLGGIVKPNDGKCHLDEEGTYTVSSLQDYPSIAHINAKVIETRVNLIFAVSIRKTQLYQQLSQMIQGSSCGQLQNDSSNVVSLIRDEYEKITSKVEMTYTASKYLKVTFYSQCLNRNGTLLQTNNCNGLKVGSLVEFEARIELIDCPKDPKEWDQVLTIRPVGIDEALTVNLTMLCDCPCEHPGDKDLHVKNSSQCNSFGTLKCGICECDQSRYGQKCECDVNDIKFGSDKKLLDRCRRDNTSTVECSGRGECVCGKCQCYPGVELGQEYSGPFCECDNLSCARHKGLPCSGADHGICDCGTCKCKTGWSGDTCECTDDKFDCMIPGTSEVCSDHGSCKCGRCQCFKDSNGATLYYGNFCELCSNCPTKCKELKNCVTCRAYSQYGKLSEVECNKCTGFELRIVNNVSLTEGSDEVICYEEDEKGCNFEFTYKYVKGAILVVAEMTPRCPLPLNVSAITWSVIVSVVLIGVVTLLLWKLFVIIQDRREFAKFEEEKANAKWDSGDNPLYKPSTSTFTNPVFNVAEPSETQEAEQK